MCTWSQGQHWKVGEKVGEGNSACVYQAISSEYPGVVLEQGHGSELDREAEVLARLRHPNIARAYARLTDASHDGEEGMHYLAVEWLWPNLACVTKSRR